MCPFAAMEKEVEKIFIEHMCIAADMAPSTLAVAAKLSASTLNRHTKDDVDVTHKLSIASLRKIADQLNVSVATLVGHREKIFKAVESHHPIPDPSELRAVVKKSPLQPKIAEPIDHFSFGPEMVPMIGRVTNSGDAVVLDFDDPIGEAPIHPNQKKIKGGFAVKMNDDTMEPRYWQGETTYPIKNSRPGPMQDCWVEFNNGTSQLRQFIKSTDKEIICKQFNPAKERKYHKSDIKALHAVDGRG